MFENKYIQQRIEKADKLREVGINPYSNESSRNSSVAKFLNVNSDIEQTEEKRDETRVYIVAGRIKLFRLMGKASFLKIEDESGMLQVYLSRDHLPEGFYNDIFKKNIEVGDIVEVTGGRLVPEWIDVDQENLKGTVKELPNREAIDVPVNEMLIVELYSK